MIIFIRWISAMIFLFNEVAYNNIGKKGKKVRALV